MDIDHTFPWFHRVFVVFVVFYCFCCCCCCGCGCGCCCVFVVVVAACILFCGGAGQYSVLSQVFSLLTFWFESLPKKSQSPWPVTHEPSDRNGRSWKTCFTSAKGSNLDPLRHPIVLGAEDHSERRKVCLVISKHSFCMDLFFRMEHLLGNRPRSLIKYLYATGTTFATYCMWYYLLLIVCQPMRN